jgi:CBS domain containing-hemolysin-like protein
MVEGLAALLLRWTGGRAVPAQLFGNRDELRALVLDSGSGLSTTERTLIHRVLELQYRTVSQIARPLSLADTVTLSTPVSELLRICREQGHTRLPVWDSGKDDGRIVGMVSLKNVLYDEPGSGRTTVGEYLLPALFLEETLRLEDALRRLQRGGMPLAIVVDATRRERGFVTLSDVLSGVFGKVAL